MNRAIIIKAWMKFCVANAKAEAQYTAGKPNAAEIYHDARNIFGVIAVKEFGPGKAEWGGNWGEPATCTYFVEPNIIYKLTTADPLRIEEVTGVTNLQET